MSYWEKRKEHDMYEAMKSAEETSQEIAEIYARASRELNYQISKIYERYRDKYDMTDEEALRLLNAMKDPADINELKMKLQGLEGEAAKEILKELESPAYRARIKRLENLQDEIDRKMKEVYKQEKKISTDHYIDQYQQSYYREIFDTKKMTGLDFSFSKVDPKRLDKVLHSNWSGANYSKRIWNNTEELAEDLKKEISLAYLTGKAERDIAHDIALKYATGASNARRLVRTESAYISGQAQAAADEECGIDKYRIVATLDLRTSKICQEMDGQVFAYKDMKVGENYPPFHPYCRTTVISVLDDQDLDVLQRRARDPETGKNKTFPASMTYKEWYAQEVEGKPEAEFREKATRNRDSDSKTYDKYKAIFGKKKAGKTLEDFQRMKYTDSEKWEELKSSKEDALDKLSEDQLKALYGMLGNKETRIWYKHKDATIPETVRAMDISLRQQAEKACDMRNHYRTVARDLMKDQKARKELDEKFPNLTFEQLLQKKKEKYGLEGDAAYESIIDSSATTNKTFDKKAGIEE